jgi:hypothetical protein
MSVAETDPDSCWLLSNINRQDKQNPGCLLRGLMDFCVETGTGYSHRHVDGDDDDDVDDNLLLRLGSALCF